MVDLKIIFQFIDKICLSEDSSSNGNGKKINIEDIPCYIFELREEPGQLTPEKVQDLLIYEGIEKKYISTDDIEYILSTQDENIPQNYKKLKELNQCLLSNSSYNLYLHIYINESNYLEEKKKEDNKKIEKEKEEKKEILSKANQITKELTEIQRQIKNLYQKPKNGENSENYYSAIKKRKRKNSFHSKVNKNSIEAPYENDKNFPISKTTVGTKNNNKNNNNDIKKEKLFFLFSSPLQNAQESKLFQEDDFYFNQWLSINYKFKSKNLYTELHLKQIKENIDLPPDTTILHIRVDSILKDEKVFFKFCNDENHCQSYNEYSLENFFKSLKNYGNLVLIIISSDNIKEIQNELDGIKRFEKVNKIYIYHPNKYGKNISMKYEDILYYENYENIFINKFYDCLTEHKNPKNSTKISIKNSFNECKNSIKPKSNEMKEAIFVEGKQEKQYYLINTKNPEEKDNNKYLLNYDTIKNNYYPIIGRKREFDLCVIKKEEKMCIYGEAGVGKKSFVKKVGFSLLNREMVNKIYYLDIYPNEINQSKRIYKIENLIKEIYDDNTNKEKEKILLIINFNDIIKGENLIEIRNEIKRERSQTKNEVSITYLYAFTTEKNEITKSIISEFPYSIELKHFNLKKQNNEEEIKNIIYDNEIKELFNYYLINKNNRNINFQIIDDIFNFSNQENNDAININNIKITNIFLVLIYINFYYKDFISSENNKLKWDENIIKLRKIIFEDTPLENIIKKIIDERKENKDIFAYLYNLKYGATLSFLKLLWGNQCKEEIKYIKNNLFGIIEVENNANEEIYKLDNSLREVIKKLLSDLIEDKKEKILKYYNLLFWQIILEMDYNKILIFNAYIDNEFWSNKKLIQGKNINFNGKYIINEEIDSNNIYDIIKNLKKDEKLLTYISDISITLPTILHYYHNDIYEDLIMKFFEEKFEMKYREYKKNENKDKIKYIRKLLIRLGIFKCWASKKFNFLKESLEKVGIRRKGDIKDLSEDTKREYILIRIYEHIIKNDNNIEEIKKDFQLYINKIEDKTEETNFDIRYKALCALCINSLKEIEFLQNNKNYKNEYDLLKNEIILYSSKNKFYFYLNNPLDASYDYPIEINNNFYLTHKLLNILPKNFQVDFKTFRSISMGKEKNNIKNINFLYLDNKKFFEEYIMKNNIKNDNKNKIHIKILILGYLDNNIEKGDLNKLNKNGIKNIIYVSNYDINLKHLSKDKVPLFCIIQKLYFQFIHNFISILFSKKNNININKAFKEAKGNYNKSLKYIFRNYFKEDLIIPKIEIIMDDEDDTFEFEYKEDDSGDLYNNEKINYIKDENDYENVKINNENIYYMKNPFAEKKEIAMNYKKSFNRKFIKLPGVESLNEEYLIRFINGGLYKIPKFKKLVNSIEEAMKTKNIFYIYGNLISKIGADICKYFYMEKEFENGIYLVRSVNDREEFESLIDSDNNKKEGLKLVVINKIFNQNKIFNNEIINKMNEKKKIIFIICSDNQEIKYREIEFYNFDSEGESEALKGLNEEYIIVQSILNNINIKY